MRSIIVLLFALSSICECFRYAWRPSTKVFPYEKFPEPSVIDNGDNEGRAYEEIVIDQEIENERNTCVRVWIGNGACNKENNKAECDWDGGDCCWASCIKNCPVSGISSGLAVSSNSSNSTNGTKVTSLKCKFACGSFNGYDCRQPNQSCQECGPKGKCLPQAECLKGNSSYPREKIVGDLIHNCYSVNWSQGNGATINIYCGKDPYKTILHDPIFPKFHYPGCGLFPTQCTLLPLCEDVINNNITAQNCDNVVKPYNFYSLKLMQVIVNNTRCYDHFLQSFLLNYAYYGQCCQCEPGWTGSDCTQAVCYPVCIHGTCIAPNVCVCDAGWQGLICQIGVCTLCEYGLCIAPEFCECFYGYKGASCNIAVSLPPCHRGVAVEPDVCQCDPGYQGRICDQPKCDIDCGPQGHCIAPNTCECDIGWESSDPSSPCDIVNPLLRDPNCVEANVNDHCTACDHEFYLDPVDFTCNKCNAVYDPMCFTCDYLQCLECLWPYDVDHFSTKGQCISTGVVEFTDLALDVIEDQKIVVISVRRNYGQKGAISVKYDMSITQPQDTRIEKAQGTVEFSDGQMIGNITLYVWKRFEFESSSVSSESATDDTVFVVKLSLPNNQAEIGDRDHIILHYFDSYDLADIRNTYSVFKELRAPVTRIGGQYIIIELGETYYIDIYSYYLSTMPKVLGQTEIYFMIQRDRLRTQLRDVTQTVHVADNHHRLDFTCYDLALSLVQIYAATPGMTVSYYSNTRFTGSPYLQRLEYLFPIILNDNQPRKYFSQFGIQYEFVVKFNVQTPLFSDKQNVTFSLKIAEYSLASVFINDVRIESLEIPMQVCLNNYDADGSSCCNNPYTYTASFNGSVPYHFTVNYVQTRQAFNGPCIKFTRQSASMALGSIEGDSMAIKPLIEGPYALQVNITDAVVVPQQSKLIYHPQYNVNTRAIVMMNQFQTCVINNFQVIVKNRFGEEFTQIPDLNITVTFTTGEISITNNTVFNSTDFSRRTTIYYCGPVGVATVSARIKSELLPEQLNLTIIPGPYQMNLSEVVEYNPLGCQAHNICQAKLDLRDLALNLVLTPVTLTANDADFQFENNNVTRSAEMFNTFTIQQTSPYSIYIDYIPRAPGAHSLFVRFQSQKVKVYPLSIQVYSTVASGVYSFITDTSILSPRVVTQPLTFYVQLCDILSNNLTESQYTIAAQIQSLDSLSIVMPQLSASKVGISLYQIQIVALIASKYQLTINVTNQATGVVTSLIGPTIQLVQYWRSYLANHTTTTVTGSAFQAIYPISGVSIAMQIRDSQLNLFNATFHAKNYSTSVFNITVIADSSTHIPVRAESETPDTGYYTFSFAVPSYFPQIVIYVLVFEEGRGYLHIPGSPFTTSMLQRDSESLCKVEDLQVAGYGQTSSSYIVEQPAQVVAGQNFTLKLVGINRYDVIYQPIFDPVQYLFSIDQVNLQCTCSPNSAICNHFSGNFTACQMNKQCKWTENSKSSAKANLFTCQPCNSFCNNQSFTLISSQTRDAVYSYFNMQVTQQGLHYTQVNVISQGYLRLLIYSNYDFSGFYSELNVYNLQNLTFNSSLSPFFATKRQMWSAALVGFIRFNQTQQGCFGLIQDRLEIQSNGQTLVTWTLTNDLDSIVLINGLQVLQKDQTQASAQFSRNCTDDELMIIEIRLRIKRQFPIANNGFMRLEQETFKSPRNTVLPLNIFYAVPSTTSLQTQINVLPAAVSGATTQVEISNCTNGRVPYSTSVSITVFDQFGNLRSLGANDNITITILKDTLPYSSINVTQIDPISQRYNLTVNLAEAANNFSVIANMNGVALALSPQCRFTVYSDDQITTIAKAGFAKYNVYFLDRDMDQDETRQFYSADFLKYGLVFNETSFQSAFKRMDTDVNGSISEQEAIAWLLELASAKGTELNVLKV